MRLDILSVEVGGNMVSSFSDLDSITSLFHLEDPQLSPTTKDKLMYCKH